MVAIAARSPVSSSLANMGNVDDPGEVFISVGIVELQVDAEPLPQGIERFAGDLELISGQRRANRRRGPTSARRSGQHFGLKFLAIGEANVPPSSTLNQASPWAPKFSTISAVSPRCPCANSARPPPLTFMRGRMPPLGRNCEKDAKLRLLGQIGDVDQFQAETQVGASCVALPWPRRKVIRGSGSFKTPGQGVLSLNGHQAVDHAMMSSAVTNEFPSPTA